MLSAAHERTPSPPSPSRFCAWASPARELGLDYRTYAGVRASTGRDVVGFLYSTNALPLLRPTDRLPEDRRACLAAPAGCDRAALAQLSLDPQADLVLAPLDAAHRALDDAVLAHHARRGRSRPA